MTIRKILTILANVAAGAIVVSVGLDMLPFPYSLIWGIFNAYIWIVAPITLYHANKSVPK